uniref:FXYD domain-containing ion transport regulator n=1 Tax=Seriola lalandi dorsalis TaxID=1841481 RepID=A0A3B4XQK0_SERLL
MATTESMFPDRSDFDYDYDTLRTTGVILAVIMFVSGILIALIPAHLVPKYQKQRFLLKLYRKYSIYLKEREEVITGATPTNTHTDTHRLFMAIPLMDNIPLLAG